MRNKLIEISKGIFDAVKQELYFEDIHEIEKTNGNSKDSPRACKSGSSVYILLDPEENVIYVGETGESIKTRCYGDGSGAHKNQKWFSKVAFVRHFTKDSSRDFSEQERKLIEQALSIHLKPEIYGKNKANL